MNNDAKEGLCSTNPDTSCLVLACFEKLGQIPPHLLHLDILFVLEKLYSRSRELQRRLAADDCTRNTIDVKQVKFPPERIPVIFHQQEEHKETNPSSGTFSRVWIRFRRTDVGLVRISQRKKNQKVIHTDNQVYHFPALKLFGSISAVGDPAYPAISVLGFHLSGSSQDMEGNEEKERLYVRRK